MLAKKCSKEDIELLVAAVRTQLAAKKKVLKLFDHLYTYAHLERNTAKLTFKEIYPAVYDGKGYADALKEKAGTGHFFKLATTLRQELDDLKATPLGRRLSARCSFPEAKNNDGCYDMSFHPDEPALKTFWQPYLQENPTSDAPRRPWLALYTENVFFRPRLMSGHFGRYFIRHLDENDTDGKILEKCGFLASDNTVERFESCRHFVSAGDVRCLIGLCQWFERLGVRTRFEAASDRIVLPNDNYYYQTLDQFRGHNLILTGNPRTFPFTKRYLERENFRYWVDSVGTIDTLRPDPNGADHHLLLSRDTVRGVLNRTYLPDQDIWITAILSNHARFIEAVLQLLTNETLMTNALKNWIDGGTLQRDLPSTFEIHLEAKVNNPTDSNPLKKYDLQIVAEPNATN